MQMEKKLKELICEHKVIPFVGAGVSKDVKFKDGRNAFIGWKELLERFIPAINNEAKENVIRALLNVAPINYLEIADKIEEYLTPKEFNDSLEKTFAIDYHEVNEETYALAKAIWNLDSKLIITTNYDKVLHHASEDKNLKSWDIQANYEQATSLRDGHKHSTVWYLHGFVENVDNIILTSKKYNEFYTHETSKSKYKAALETLKNTIASKSLLFIGCSFDDLFIKDQIKQIIDIFDGNTGEHYILVKKGTQVDTLNGILKVIEYEDHGQPLIEKLNSFKPNEQATHITQQFSGKALTSLPPKNENFIGRKKDLEALEKTLANDSVTFIVNGIGGVGKSELANEYFHRNKHKYKNLAFIEIPKESSNIEALFFTKFKETLFLGNDATLESIVKRLQGLPSKNLLLLDNLERKEDFEKIKALNVSFDLLITTRISNIDAKNQLNLETLTPEDAKELFLSLYDKDKNIDDILQYLDNHPLFINLIAKSLHQGYITLEDLRKAIQNHSIAKIDATDDKTFKEHLQDTFDRQFAKESDNELKTLLQYLSIFPSIEIEFSIFEKSLALDKLRVKLQRLVDRGWLIKKEESYKLHQIIKTFLQTEYPIAYEDVTFIFKNIATFIDPEDSTLIASKLSAYIPIIELFLEAYSEKRDATMCCLLDSLTYLYYNFGRYTVGLNHQKKAFNIRKILFGDFSEEIAKSYNLLGMLYGDMGKSSEALKCQNKAIELREEILGKNHPDVAHNYNNISLVYHALGKLSLALQYQHKAIKIREECLGERDPNVAISYNNISIVYQDMGKLTEAFQYQEKAMILRESILGINHPSVANSYHNMASIYLSMKKLSKALYYQQKTIEIEEALLSENDPDIAISYNNMAHIYQQLKEYQKAKVFLVKAVTVLEKLDYIHPFLYMSKSGLKIIEASIKKQQKAGYKDKGRFCKDV